MRTTLLFASALCTVTLSSCSSGLVNSLGPIDKDQAVWKGPWKSTDYPGIFGTVATVLPANLEAGQKVDVPVVSKSSRLSLWMPGKTFAGRGKGVIAEDGIATATAQAGKLKPAEEVRLRLSQYLGDSSMISKFVMQFNAERTAASGFWVSNDGDKGTFQISKTEELPNSKKTQQYPIGKSSVNNFPINGK